MSDLTAEIDREKSTALFHGPGTFQAKERIKQLGKARWQGEKKSWLVSNFNLTNSQLEALFPNINIEETASAKLSQDTSEDAVNDTSENKKSPVPKKAANPKKKSSSENLKQLGSGNTENALSVPEIVGLARAAIQSAFPEVIHVYGILQSVKRYGERVYMNLASEAGSKESVSCVIWGGEKQLCSELLDKGFELEAELQVMFAVKVDLNPSRSSISLNVVGVVAEYTLGKLAALREKTNSRLKEEGLFEKNKDLSLPLLPLKLGVLTSAGGTVINDFKASLDLAEFGFKLYWYPVSVQGSAASKDIVKGIKVLSGIKKLDAILLFRGGGSAADLMVFNEYNVAKAICKCPIPVLSAIGHQEDQSSVQDVSFQALGVPKDLGRYFADIIDSVRTDFYNCSSDILSLAEENWENRNENLAFIARDISTTGSELVALRAEECRSFRVYLPSIARTSLSQSRIMLKGALAPIAPLSKGVYGNALSDFDSEKRRLQLSVSNKKSLLAEKLRSVSSQISEKLKSVIGQSRIQLFSYEQIFQELDPESQLRRGFAMVRRNERLVSSGKSLVKDDQLSLVFYDSTRKIRVED